MNRLIIIGNGFDLAHGLKTSCKHFILHYLSTVWSELVNGSYSDRLINIERSAAYFKDHDLNYSNDTAIMLFKKIDKNKSDGPDDAYMMINSNFFRAIFNKIVKLNWADIETEYFNELFYIIQNLKGINASRIEAESIRHDKIKSLNEDLDFLQEKLIEYLKIEENKIDNIDVLNIGYSDLFSESIFEGERLQPHSDHPSRTRYLNFNYTKTLSKYILAGDVFYIHGTLNENPIFGFGDDTSPKYEILEDEYDNEALKKIKSFKYLDNDTYSKLVHFINSGDFQVHIYGHSCGVSDRTLFKQIFENDHCKMIKIFYHDKHDFDEKKYEISRHFGNKVEFLRKVVSYDNLRPMPQIKKD